MKTTETLVRPVHTFTITKPRNDWEKAQYKIFRYNTTLLYYVSLIHPTTGRTAYKVGITTKGIGGRFEKEEAMGYTIKVLDTAWFFNGWEAYNAEQSLLSYYTSHRPYDNTHNSYLAGTGNSEVFSEDVLNGQLPLLKLTKSRKSTSIVTQQPKETI